LADTGGRLAYLYLKSIDLFGFKTFAERTRLVFEPGIAAIVGPNGSGKSNFVDAARWVLGEQSAKQLRGARMDEVIFAGNTHRRPLGMAEVTLTFDNADGTLPMPFAEISVTRRCYRTGDSEYFLNRTQVRLRDIMDLLLGTGLGPDASAIVSQGQIDSILSAKPAERRELFEEAAGTSKYQARKREAQRRLDQTEANALRVNDVLAEIEQQVPAIESQVRRAKRYRKATQLLRDLEILSYVRKTAARREERGKLTDVLASDDTRQAGEKAQRERIQTELNETRYEEYQATVALDERTAAYSETAALVQTAATSHAAAQARAEDAERRCLDHARDASGAELAVQTAGERIETLVRELAASRKRRDDALGGAERAAAAERTGSQAWEAAYSALRAVEDRRAAAAADAAESDTASHAAAAHCERLVENVSHLDGEARAADAHRDSVASRTSELRATTEELARRIEALSKAAVDAAALRDARGADVDKERSSVEAARAKVVELGARLAAHKEFEEAGAGAPPGVRAVTAARESSLRGAIGTIADLIEVDAAYAAAIDVALGAKAHDVLTKTSADARAAIDYLKSKRAGRATLRPLDLARQRPLPLAPDASKAPGYVGKAIDLVRCRDDVRDAIEHALGDVVIVRTLPDALALAQSAPDTAVVTLDGEIVRGPAITGGTGDGETGPLARRVLAEELRRERDAAGALVDAAEKRLTEARAAAAQAAADVERAAAARVDAELQRRDVRSALDHAAEESAEIEARRNSLADAMVKAKADLDAARAEAKRYDERSRTAREAAAKLESDRARAAGEADKLQSTLSDLRDAHRTSAAEAAALVERVAQAGDDVESARADLAASKIAQEERAAALEGARAERDSMRTDAADLSRKKVEAEGQLQEVEAQVQALRGKRDELGARARAASEAVDAAQARERERSLEEQTHRIRLAEIDAELSLLQETFAQNPATDAECTAVGERHKNFEGEADTEIRRLRDEVARLGNVNLNALEDQAALLERREFLRGQLADLQKARESILSVIAEIDAESLRRFNETFDKVAVAFSETFARLFTGGVGKIWLADSPDPTQAGIEIAVQPPGKKMQSLNLLSGGERAMTAVALIFAILQVRPSPFYIFDEIDAALDEANIGRFGSLLRELADRAQTIIITHNKATMTLADRIYGVTMGEPGISNILSLALEQASA
jgi:chromosome segregation protein